MLNDFRHAIRALTRRPGFTAIAVLTLALGIGANSALFSMANSLLFRPPPGLNGTDRLVWVMGGDRFRSVSYPDYLDFRKGTPEIFSGLAAYSTTGIALGSGIEPITIGGQIVSRNYFRVLGATPKRGRGFVTETTDPAGTARVAIISHTLWRNRFGADPERVGSAIILNSHPFVLVGVAPNGFKGTAVGHSTDVWVPTQSQSVAMPRGYDVLADRALPRFQLIGRLQEGVSPKQAQASLRVIAARINPLEPERLEPMHPLVEPLRGWIPIAHLGGGLLSALALAGVVTVMVLLISCSNVANLLLAWAARRRRELGIRLALGAGRRRLLRHLLSESVLLALLGGGIGLRPALSRASSRAGCRRGTPRGLIRCTRCERSRNWPYRFVLRPA